MSNVVDVAVAAIINSHNEILISLRPNHVHQGGLWEFPGGKFDIGETVEQALHREIKEELNISIQSAHPLIVLQHKYVDKTVRLHVWKVTEYSHQEGVNLNRRLGVEGQEIKWQTLSSLDAGQFPAADKSIITALQLPNEYLITGNFKSVDDFEMRLMKAINRGLSLLQLRLKSNWINDNASLAEQVFKLALDRCEKNNVILMLNVPDAFRLPKCPDLKNKMIGLHLDSFRLNEVGDDFVKRQTGCKYVSASCHTQADMEKAKKLGVDFIVLSPVQKTASHPDAIPLGWQKFSNYVKNCDFPVYALGGVTLDDINMAQQHGAQGIAGIGYGW